MASSGASPARTRLELNNNSNNNNNNNNVDAFVMNIIMVIMITIIMIIIIIMILIIIIVVVIGLRGFLRCMQRIHVHIAHTLVDFVHVVFLAVSVLLLIPECVHIMISASAMPGIV